MNRIKMGSEQRRMTLILTVIVFLVIIIDDRTLAMTAAEKNEMKNKVLEMFNHAYGSYMNYAFPADELMPLSCKGRHRGTEPSRGDIDDALGNFTLTLIDTLDTLAVLGNIGEFESAVKHVIKEAKFDTDIVVSVFETNIRVLGGLLGAHCVATAFKKKRQGMLWYNEELLRMAKDLGERLLPAFNTTTGMPFPRVNLNKGIQGKIPRHEQDTCTACAGTMILEFAALSRLTGDSIFEEKARKAMDFIWQQRHRATDLVGTVINIHNGDWVRRESGVGAGIDSYYEYVLKAYILLGDDTYLDRFNKHYDAVMKYVSQGPLLVDVQMHKPQANSRHFMDSLLAFWPGLQVLKGDIRPAIETHEMLYQVIQRHNFLPEAFTTDFRVHWGQHPLRPEFVESTYFLYKATGDHHYLDVGKKVIENLEKHARVRCGFAAIKDVTSGLHEDQMDSFVLAETFKYLYLLFAEKDDLVLDVDDYLFTTEAHLLPLSLSIINSTFSSTPEVKITRESYIRPLEEDMSEDEALKAGAEEEFHNTCPNTQYLFPDDRNYADSLRKSLKDMVESVCPKPKHNGARSPRLRAIDFIAGNKQQLEALRRMGIRLVTMSDGRVQLLHTASEAATTEDAEDGMLFMQEMIELSKTQQHEAQHDPLSVQVVFPDELSHLAFTAGPAQFGIDLKSAPPLMGSLAITSPFKACASIENPLELRGRIAILERGECMFIDKARNIINAGAIAGIVIDHNEGSSSEGSPLFAMSGDGKQDVAIPMVFLFHKQGKELCEALVGSPDMEVILSGKPIPKADEEVGSNATPKTDANEDFPEGPSSTGTCHRDNPVTEAQRHLEDREENEWIHFRPGTSSEDAAGNQVKSGKYRMKVGETNVHMEVKVTTREPKTETEQVAPEDDVIKLVTEEDGSKQLSFKFDQMMKDTDLSGKPLLNQLYIELVRVLQERTNFSQLKMQAEYLVAVAKLLEAAYFNLSVDNHSRQLFQLLADELEILSPLQEGEGNTEGEVGEEETGALIHDSVLEEHQTVPQQETVPDDGEQYLPHEQYQMEDGFLEGGGEHHTKERSVFDFTRPEEVAEDSQDSKYVKNVPLRKDNNVGALVGEDGVLYIPDDSAAEAVRNDGALHMPKGSPGEGATIDTPSSLKGDGVMNKNPRTGSDTKESGSKIDRSRTDSSLESDSSNTFAERTERSSDDIPKGKDRS